MCTYGNYLRSPNHSTRYENPIKILIIRVNVAAKNNYPKLSGIKKKITQVLCTVNFADTAEEQMTGSYNCTAFLEIIAFGVKHL